MALALALEHRDIGGNATDTFLRKAPAYMRFSSVIQQHLAGSSLPAESAHPSQVRVHGPGGPIAMMTPV